MAPRTLEGDWATRGRAHEALQSVLEGNHAPMRGFLASNLTVVEVETKAAKRLLEAHLDVVLARLQGEAEMPKAETANSDFLDLAQGVELQELAHLTASRLAERAKRLQSALTRVADGEYGVCSECGAAIARKRLLAVPDATTCLACQERLERASP